MKKNIYLFILLLLIFQFLTAQQVATSSTDGAGREYRSTPEKVNDLVHTKLRLHFDFTKKQVYGEEWLTVQPHFYPVQELSLDAKAMLIHEVTINGNSLKYQYDRKILKIQLDKIYNRQNNYTIYINYTARPEDVKEEGSEAIKYAKGIYFINADGKDPNKPTQIWTQGETESNSAWFPTIDKPNQKSTQEIYLTVPDRFITLSNGLLKEQVKNNDGTRTDYWKMDLPHAPYLFFIGIGEFAIVKDQWNEVPVNYYLEKRYAPYAKKIFGNTPEMLDFFSRITQIKYPWPKYDQMIVRDFVSGAMENTTAVSHSEMAYEVIEEEAGENSWEGTIAHETFHHWFGDLVTAESWSNLTLNESFATYGTYLWYEYKYGKDYAESERLKNLMGYFSKKGFKNNLVRFYYDKREDIFDTVSYNKGSEILHMLHKYLGDDVFFAAMKKYLVNHCFDTAEAHQWRIALEEISGKDLNWFFNQWYCGYGHPKLDIRQTYDKGSGKIVLAIAQTQDEPIFEFPYSVDIYRKDGSKEHREFWVRKKKENIFYLDFPQEPALVNPDPDHVLLANVESHKSLKDWIFQYKYASGFFDRYEALKYISASEEHLGKGQEMLIKALKDNYYGLRILSLNYLNLKDNKTRKKALPIILDMAQNDTKNLVQAFAIIKLSELNNRKDFTNIFKKGSKSSSRVVQKASLEALSGSK
ncbi:M1 family metallopeptidase [Bacteroidetes bacterium endosymbiont of Geopemphigus sp.]|uniref:M1 family metallopeptidase n=1 Tax=Bacteroidetes bacterium endosymbiont of Geopemphigus sp. TaxID=2047937 RepID=UPI000CD01EB2|nr:M1 family metallopeptidase [Bacteroidetes bacterium endosymbiont of Geopemphigus sp.]